jgi:DNA-binding NtrC family response regulator
MTARKILIVDDELSVRQSLQEWFLEDGFAVATAEDGAEALRKMDDGPYDIVLLDLKMPGMDGITVQKRIRDVDKDASIIILTAYASVETAVEALKLGAFDYVTKPIDPDDLSHLIRNALRQRELSEENVRLRNKVKEMAAASPIIGECPKMQRVFELIHTVAETDSTVVIRGESGTGKELIARAIHVQSGRRFFPIVTVNAGSIPETLLESELFGHEKGAFTGAQYRRKGKVELAHGGTLFLDEIGDVTPKMQIDLLRVIETKRFTRLGGNQEISRCARCHPRRRHCSRPTRGRGTSASSRTRSSGRWSSATTIRSPPPTCRCVHRATRPRRRTTARSPRSNACTSSACSKSSMGT